MVQVGRLGVGPTDLQLLINMAGDAAMLRLVSCWAMALGEREALLVTNASRIPWPRACVSACGAPGIPLPPR